MEQKNREIRSAQWLIHKIQFRKRKSIFHKIKVRIFLEFMEKAQDNHTCVLCIPPDKTFKLDPLERNFVLDLKKHFVEECQKWLLTNSDESINLNKILYRKAYLQAATPLNAMHGFEQCGIHPFNQLIFANEENVSQVAPVII